MLNVAAEYVSARYLVEQLYINVSGDQSAHQPVVRLGRDVLGTTPDGRHQMFAYQADDPLDDILVSLESPKE